MGKWRNGERLMNWTDQCSLAVFRLICMCSVYILFKSLEIRLSCACHSTHPVSVSVRLAYFASFILSTGALGEGLLECRYCYNSWFICWLHRGGRLAKNSWGRTFSVCIFSKGMLYCSKSVKSWTCGHLVERTGTYRESQDFFRKFRISKKVWGFSQGKTYLFFLSV